MKLILAHNTIHGSSNLVCDWQEFDVIARDIIGNSDVWTAEHKFVKNEYTWTREIKELLRIKRSTTAGSTPSTSS